jgi:hypothetical protein
MNTSILTIVLTGAWLAGVNAAPTWQHDYRQAQQQASAQKKPLVVVFGSGANGWTKVIREDAPSPEAKQLLIDKYVCMYVDTASHAGKRFAQDFDISGSTGVVISDQVGTSQAFWHQGDMADKTLVRYLQKYADPQVVVNGTETVNTSRTSFYPTSASQPFGAFSGPSSGFSNSSRSC